jgi:hypothetical protein
MPGRGKNMTAARDEPVFPATAGKREFAALSSNIGIARNQWKGVKDMISLRALSLAACILCLLIYGGCAKSPGPPAQPAGEAIKLDNDHRTPEMVCAEFLDAFRTRDMEKLRRCTTQKSFSEAKEGIKANPSYQGVRNYRFLGTTCKGDKAEVTAQGEIQSGGDWAPSKGKILVKMDGGRWKVVAGRWSGNDRDERGIESPDTH